MMRIGIVLLPQQRWKLARERWVRAERYGFDHAWTYDHLAWRSLADEPWFATAEKLVDRWDAPAFDPDFKADSLASFEPEVVKVFSKPVRAPMRSGTAATGRILPLNGRK